MNKKITFYPTCEGAKLFPPVPMKETIPDWMKNLKPMIENRELTAKDFSQNNFSTPLSGKRCVPLADYMMSGYSLKTHCDILISTYVDKTSQHLGFNYVIPSAEQENVMGSHPHEQLPILIDGLKRPYIKLYVGWYIKTPPGYSCLIYPNAYLFEDRFELFPAIVDTDNYDGVIGSIGYIKGSKALDFKIEAGTDILTIFPFKRDEWKSEIRNDIVDKKNQGKFSMMSKIYFEGVYRKFFHSKKKYI